MKNLSRREFLKRSSQAAIAAGYGLLLKGCSSKKDFDWIIKNGMIVDGSGEEGFIGDIGIKDEIIREVGKINSNKGQFICDASGLVVSPGFVDPHSHADIELLVNAKAESAVRQGVTTLISGNCGSSPFPVSEAVYDEMKTELNEQYRLELDWMDIKGFLSQLEKQGISLNYATLVGHGTIRGKAMGYNDRPPSEEELETMKALVEENMRNGALGLSSGLEYSPGSYASVDELIELSKIVARLNGVYATHMRDEGDFLIESLQESFKVAKETGVNLQISHLKVAYPRNWDKIDRVFLEIEKASTGGIKVFCDRYPYIAGSTGLSFYFPLWARQGTTDDFISRLKDPNLEAKFKSYLSEQEKKLGSWEKVVISSVVSEKNKVFEGMSVLEGSQKTGKSPFQFMRDLLIEENNKVGMVTFMMKEENLKRILAHPLVGIGSDGSTLAPYGLLAKGKPHPRSYGTFPRALSKYVREEKIVPLPEMIRKMTSAPARKFNLTQRGLIKNGYFSDLVVFDFNKIKDRATWTEPHQYSAGVEYVFTNGEMVIDRGEQTGNLPGKVLRKEIPDKPYF